MLTKILDIAYEIDAAGNLQLEQGCDMGNDGDVARMELHPLHVRLFAEELGLLQAPPTQCSKQRATLERRLLLLRNRAEEMHDMLAAKIMMPSGDRIPEADHSEATLLLLNEFCAEFAPSNAEFVESGDSGDDGVTVAALPAAVTASSSQSADAVKRDPQGNLL